MTAFLGANHRRGVAALVATLAVVAACSAVWAGNPVTVSSLLSVVVTGVALGAIYSLAASGLVVAYTTTGVFNFAQGAIGMLMAFCYWQLSQGWGVPAPVAIALVVLVLAPAPGVLLDVAVMRHAAPRDLVVKLLITVAVTSFLMGVAAWIWEPNEARSVPFLFPGGGVQVGETFVLYHRLITIAAGLIVAVALRVFLGRSRLGLSMRAAVDNPSLASLHGARPNVASMSAWVLSSMLAAVSGVLVVSELTLNVESLTLLIINAFAAAIIGRLRSLPMTVAGGLVLGVANSFALSFLSFTGPWQNTPQALPTVVLFVALLALPSAPISVGRRQSTLRFRTPTWTVAVSGAASLVVVVGVLLNVFGTTNQLRLISAVVTAVILLPLVPLIGWSGQVALAPLTFAGLGAWVMVRWATGGEMWGLALAAVVAVPIGIAMALPALRLRGLYLALASVAFARGMELLFFPRIDVLGGSGNGVVQRPDLFGLDLRSDVRYGVFCTAVFSTLALALVGVRRSAAGRRMVAMRDSESACAMLGMDSRWMKLGVFALSAAIGAVGGALLAMLRGTPTPGDFTMFGGLGLVLLLVLGGVGVLSGAVAAGGASFLFGWVGASFSGVAATAITRLGPGAGAIGMARSAGGIAGDLGAAIGDLGRRCRQPTSPGVRAPRSRRVVDVDAALDPGFGRPFTSAQLSGLDARLGLSRER